MSVIGSFIEERRVDAKFQSRLNELQETEQVIVERLIQCLSPSANTLRELIRLAEEIAARESRSLLDVLSAEKINQLLEHSSSKKERQRLIRQELEQQRFPKLHKLHAELNQYQTQLLNDLGLRLELPRDLEGDTLSLTISAKTARDFERQGAKITELSTHPALARIFSLLKGDF